MRPHGVVLARPLVRSGRVAVAGLVSWRSRGRRGRHRRRLIALGRRVRARAVWRWERTRIVVTSEKLFVVNGTRTAGRRRCGCGRSTRSSSTSRSSASCSATGPSSSGPALATSPAEQVCRSSRARHLKGGFGDLWLSPGPRCSPRERRPRSHQADEAWVLPASLHSERPSRPGEEQDAANAPKANTVRPTQRLHWLGMAADELVVHGAREHNLKDITVRLPRNSLICITGLSGSGKSSLAFDTIYAEGQRRYVESLSAYARQFLQMMEKPDVDSIDGLSPAISIDQKTTSRNPRSTVGTVTEIYDYLRLLYARIGRPHCPVCGRPIAGQSIESIVDQVLRLPEGTKFTVNAPVVRDRKGEYKDLFEELRARRLHAREGRRRAADARGARSSSTRSSSTRSRSSSTGS